MFSRLLSTKEDWKLTLTRLALGAVFFPHGAQKMLGWFGGYGFSATMHAFTNGQHIPAVFAFLAIAAEFFGSLGLIFGCLARVAAFGIAVNTCVAVTLVHAHNGFFMNWAGHKAGEGFEYHILAIAMALVIMLGGAGAMSVDRALSSQ